MIRGIERRKIFNDDNDRNDFIERLSLLLPETTTQCYAWSFLSNHAHFLLRSGPAGIAFHGFRGTAKKAMPAHHESLLAIRGYHNL